MSLRFILGNAGYGKSHYLCEHVIAEAVRHPEITYLAVVPEQFTMQTQKDFVTMHPKHGILNIDVLSFQRLAYRVFDEVGVKTRMVLEETGKNLILRKLAEEQKESLPVLGSNLKRPGYIGEIKSMISELTQYDIPSSRLKEMAERLEKKPQLAYKLKDIQAVYESFEHYLADEYITAEQLLDVLSQQVEKSKRLRDSVLVLDGFTGFTPIQNKVLQKLLKICKEVWITITIDHRHVDDSFYLEQELFALSKRTMRSLKQMAEEAGVPLLPAVRLDGRGGNRYTHAKALHFLEQQLFRFGGQAYEEEQQELVLRAARNPWEETEKAVQEIRRLVMEEGFRYGETAIITGDLKAYSHPIEQLCAAYDIPCFLDYKRSVLLNPLIEFIRSFFAMMDQNYSYDTVFRYLRCSLSGVTQEEADILENYVLALGVRGFLGWNQKWIRAYKGLSEEELLEAETIRMRVMEELAPITPVFQKKAVTVRERTRVFYEFLVQRQAERQLAAMAAYFQEQRETALQKEYEQIYEIVMELFDKLVSLLGDEVMPLSEYAEILDSGFEEAKVGIIPPGVDQVLAGDIERTRLKDIRALFFLGVNEGIVPKNSKGGGILSEMDREILAGEKLELAPGRRQQSYIQKFYLYLALTKPGEKLFLSYSLAGSDGKLLRPSYLISTLQRLFPKTEVDFVEAAPGDYKELLTRQQGIQAVIDGLKDYREGKETKEFLELYRFYAKEEAYQKKIRQLLEGTFFTYENTPLGHAVARALYGRQLTASVSRLERYAACAYSYFLTYGLKLTERAEYAFEAVDMGNIFHEALEEFSRRLQQSSYTWFDLPEELQREWIDACIDRAVTDYGNTVLYSTARNEYMITRMKRIGRRTVWALGEQLKKGDFVPEQYEVSFSMVDHLDAVNIALSEEERLHLLGRIDRVDTCETENQVYVKVIDYKSGNKTFDLAAFYHGLQLQLVVYLNAAMELTAQSHPGKEIVPAGIFYYAMQDPVLSVEEKQTPEQINRKLLEELKLSGLVNAEKEVIARLDKEMGDKSSVIPVSFTKAGGFTSASKVADRRRFAALSSFVTKKIEEIGTSILQGEIGVSPYEMDGERACTYCVYQGICGFDKKSEGYRYRRLKQLEEEEIWEEIEGKQE